MTLVGKKAPDFTAHAVFEDNTVQQVNLKRYLEGKYGILFFYPLNFTFVCPSEIIAFSNSYDKFLERNTLVLGVSVDSHYSHLAYKNTARNAGGLGKIKFPLVSDLSKKISTDYDVVHETSVAYRGTFLIDKDGIVRHQSVNDLPIGRNVKEFLRILDAWQHYEENGEVCPVGWHKGQDAIKPTQEGITNYLTKNAEGL